ncbi:MAG TPA: carboxypeptidase regulatory-like domain-containing protein, partial [Gemmataceae bacterium]|nr:carboxypeptidase regulatory-like domain-containing protein [Gemmataceae bacterium]
HPQAFDESIVAGAKGELKNVVVYVKDGAKLGGEVPKEPVVLDQKNCVYTPHVVAVMVGQELKARNSDNFLHNVHGLAKDNGEFNFPQQNAGQENKVDATKAPEKYKVKCDVHPWMAAWVVVLDHPYSAVTGDNGEFTIKGLKDGKYTLEAWQEKLGTKSAEVEIKDGKAVAPIEFKFEPKKPKADAGAVPGVTPVLAAVKAAATEESCPECEKSVVKTDAKVAAK